MEVRMSKSTNVTQGTLNALFSIFKAPTEDTQVSKDRDVLDAHIIEAIKQPSYSENGTHGTTDVSLSSLRESHKDVATRNRSIISEILEFVPEFNRDREVMVPSIFAPDTMTPDSVNLAIDLDQNIDVSSILKYIQTEIITKYELIDKAIRWTGEAMYETGASPVWVCPTSVLNVAKDAPSPMEHVTSMESVTSLFSTETHDKVFTSIGANLELQVGADDAPVATLEGANILRVGGVNVLNSSDTSSSARYFRKLPVESVIPLSIAGDAQTHLGYLVALDDTNRPLQQSYVERGKRDMSSSFTKFFEDGDNMYSKEKVMSRLLNAGLDKTFLKGYTVSEEAAALNLAFTASMRKNKVRFVYVPREDMAYFAFKYRSDGTGMAIPEKVLQVAELRLMSIVGNIVAGIDNSSPKKVVTLNGKDVLQTNPLPLINQARDIFSRGILPSGHYQPAGIMAAIRRFSTEVIMPEAEGLSGINVDVSSRSSERPSIDGDVIETLSRMIRSNCELPASMLSDDHPEDFSRGVVSSNLILSNKVHGYQVIINKCLTLIISRIARSDAVLIEKVKSLLNTAKNTDSNEIDLDIDRLLGSIVATLPTPRLLTTTQDINEMETVVSKWRAISEGLYPESLVSSEEDRAIGEVYKRLRDQHTRKGIIEWLATAGASTSMSKVHFDQEDIEDIEKLIQVTKNASKAFEIAENLDADDGEGSGDSGGSKW